MSPTGRAPTRATLPHMPALDGLRGLAVLGVLLFHDGRLAGGYLGVDLFFVLSGFLITANLLAERASTGSIGLRAFWARRARRLFPALLALVLAVGAAAPLMSSAVERARVRSDGLAALGYVANWHALSAGRSYWDLFAAPSPFEHTWSLAIEEQFYVLWPLIAWLALRARRPRLGLGLVAGALALASALALACAFEWAGSPRAYLGTDTRAAGILSGAALACALHGRAPLAPRAARWLDLAGGAGLLGLALAWARLDGADPFLYRGGLWLSELSCLALVACASQPRASRIARALAFRPLVWAGVVSYGVYLAHWPLFIVLTPGRLGLAGAPLSLVRFALTFAVAAASLRWLEDPIRRRGLRIGRPRILVPAAFAAAAGVLVAGTSLPRRGTLAGPAAAHAGGGPPLDGAPRLLVLGDSVAATLGERMEAEGARAGVRVTVRGVVECSVLDGVRPTRSVHDRPNRGGNCAARWAAEAAEVRPRATLVLLGGAALGSAHVGGRWRRACDAGFREAYARELARRLDAIRGDAGRIVLARAPRPVGPWGSAAIDERTACFNEILEDVARRVRGARVLDLDRRICPRDCILESDGAPVRPDGLHFRGRGADAAARWVLESLGLDGGQSRRLPASQARPAL